MSPISERMAQVMKHQRNRHNANFAFTYYYFIPFKK